MKSPLETDPKWLATVLMLQIRKGLEKDLMERAEEIIQDVINKAVDELKIEAQKYLDTHGYKEIVEFYVKRPNEKRS